MKDVVTPKQVAQAIGVSESSVKRWCDQGQIPTVRTAGGHRRLPISGVLKFLRENGHPLVRPDLLGLPPATGSGERVFQRALDEFREAVVTGDEAASRRVIFDLYLGQQCLSRICDEIIAAAFEQIGEDWDCGVVHVYQERRACEIAIRILHEIRAALPTPDPDKLAIGGTLSGDQYSLPTTMVELVLRDLGWRACSLGIGLPVETLRAAIDETRPKLFWLSVSHLTDADRFLGDFEQLRNSAEEFGCGVVVGGRGLSGGELRKQMQYTAYCDNLQHLEQFVANLNRTPAAS